jgi:hypothetical protein
MGHVCVEFRGSGLIVVEVFNCSLQRLKIKEDNGRLIIFSAMGYFSF